MVRSLRLLGVRVQELHSYAVFCDDVRSEANGKNFFVGVYQDSMFFEAPAPWALPTFSVHIVLREPLVMPVPEVTISIETQTASGRNVLWTATHPPSQDIQFFRHRFSFEDQTDERKALVSRFNVQFAPLIFEEETRIEVKVKMGDSEPKIIDRLRISSQQPEGKPLSEA